MSFHVSFFPTDNATATPFGYSGSNTGSTFSGFALAGGGTPLFGASNTPFGELRGGGGGGLGVNLRILETTEKTRSGYGFLPRPHAFFASLFTARLYLEAQNRLLSIPTYPAKSSLERMGSYGKHAAASGQANIDSFCITSKFL